jgi:hypothetical protein
MSVRVVQGEAVAHQPITKIGTADGARRHGAAVTVRVIGRQLTGERIEAFVALAPQRCGKLSSPRQSWLFRANRSPEPYAGSPNFRRMPSV